MDYLLRAPVALIGLFLIRGLLYPRGWAGRSLPSALFASIGFALTLPLASYSGAGLAVTVAAAALVLFPYRAVTVRFMKARAKAGLQALARRWGTELQDDAETGRWDVACERDGRAMWAGNVLTHKGSIDPGVRRRETRYMLAFVIELRREPPFQCSLMIGWEKPRYFEREWRTTHVIQAEYLALPFGELGLESDRGRVTGGAVAELRLYEGLGEGAPGDFVALGTHPEAFARILSGDLLDAFRRVAARTYPYELNVTPTSVNIYTTYCGADVQLANLEFLEKLVHRLEGSV